ncbi:MAG: oxidoreductase [Promethearchaeota archaeon CR_4]|nr:MAG: oxidoreductase [Candidatus Lokiarchaeota archaeon CR_4]
MKEFDLVIVGSGVGLTVLNEALERGLKCALVEDGKLGGTCLTRGCIPSKVLIYPADIIRLAEHAKKVGVFLKLEKLDWNLLAERMWSQIDESKEMEKGLAKVPEVEVFRGIAEFTGDYTMKVKLHEGGKYSEEFKGEKIVLASGARSFIPPIQGIEETGYVTNESFFDEKFPTKPYESLIIIGGGVIAAEFAHMFSAFGTKVTIVEMLPRLVTTEEPEISALLLKVFLKRMTVHLNKKAIVARKEGNLKVLTLEETGTGKRQEVKAQEILIAGGRKSNADLLKVEKTGVDVDQRGWIKTNEFLETSKKNIWTIGDANGLFQFRHKANTEAEICTQNIFNNVKARVDYSAVPWVIFTDPQIGHVGMTEAEAIASGHQIYVARKNYSTVAKGFAMGYERGDTDDGFFKLIVDKSYQILGAHVIGPQAETLIQPFVYLMNAGFTCAPPVEQVGTPIPKLRRACPEGGSFFPIYRSMVVHPSLNEVTGWAIGSLRPVNIPHEHDHKHEHEQEE